MTTDRPISEDDEFWSEEAIAASLDEIAKELNIIDDIEGLALLRQCYHSLALKRAANRLQFVKRNQIKEWTIELNKAKGDVKAKAA